ncbi:potassium channel family protein [Pseudonocardia asaccharolytica]|uniref:Potassium transporter n=1 Tax=Pseudonocardia asaccharolytica DSM 44247 = NBRC 16224 TaxID=1123024 RepID=A0A511D4I0_9PSEU|nr:TrkA family potassium uptake protein [Pseudonocardia asaccharolytica]GEL19567.1 potassium transporter [Pseudonocardia asaccharolytica DSM 44247 = NBRC 16224]
MAREDRTSRPSRVVVLGLGRFGASLAQELVRRGSEVLAVDSNPVLVQKYADELTHAAVADTTDEEALRQLDVPDYKRAVVGIGTDLEASILTTAVLVDLGVPQIWAKATSRQHGRILERVGAHHVVLPEHEMGERVAHLVTGRMIDYIKFEDDFAMVKTAAPREIVGRTLADSGVRSRHGITVVGIKRLGQPFTYATEETVIQPGDLLIVSGRIHQVEAFADRV